MKKKIYAIILVLIAMVSITVNAKTDNAFYAEDSVSLNKTINTTSFVAGNNVDVSSTVDVLNFIAGNNVNVSSIQDYAFIAGNIVTLKEVTAKDAFVAGSIVKVYSSNIRDLYAAGETVVINSDISRNLYVGGENITINSTINGDVNLGGGYITIGDKAVINGNLVYNDDAEIDISESASIENTKTYESKEKDNADLNVSPMATVISTITTKLMSFLSILAISILLIALNKKVFKEITKVSKDISNVFLTIVKGFGFLCGLPIAAIILMVTVIGLPISIISLLVYGILIYLSITPTAYFIGNWLLKDKIKNEYLVFTISLLVIYVLKLLPVIGGYISFASLCLGLGIYVTLFSKYLKSNK